jgi:hypothetical protein
MRVINTLSAREADELKRRLADRDLNITPKGPKASRSTSAADWERVRLQLLRALRS